jgi:transketolase
MIKLTEKYQNKKSVDFRDATFDAVAEIMKNDSESVLLTNDMGAFGLDKIAEFAPERVINVGITEQNMMSLAAGLAMTGRTVFVYGIVSHIIFRALEQIKLDICVQNLSVIILGVGTGLSYGQDGPTHHGTEDIGALRSLPNITIFNPSDAFSISFAVKNAYEIKSPCYIRMDKALLPHIYDNTYDLSENILSHGESIGGSIITSGITLWSGLYAQSLLSKTNIHCNVIDIIKIKPLNHEKLLSFVDHSEWIYIVEESAQNGGFSADICIALRNKAFTFIEIVNFKDQYLLGSAERQWSWKKYKLDGESVANEVLSLLQR